MAASTAPQGHHDHETAPRPSLTPSSSPGPGNAARDARERGISGLAEAIERAYAAPQTNFPSHDTALDDHLGMWWYDTIRVIFARWDCDNDECPGLPAWDDALGEQGQAALDAARADVLELFRDAIADFATLFKEEHPEAALREPEAAAA